MRAPVIIETKNLTGDLPRQTSNSLIVIFSQLVQPESRRELEASALHLFRSA